MQYQWYPGHMSKAKRQMTDELKLIDAIIELVDARIPASSKNPDIEKMANGKARVLILNKYDMADPAVSAKWKKYYESRGYFVVTVNSKNRKDFKIVKDTIAESCKEKVERNLKKGIKNKTVRAMICGIPNVGKSTFINTFVGKASTKTGNKPGVTTGKQWIRISDNIDLLDTPGILWPKFEDETTGMRLAFIGSINDNILVPSEMAYDLIDAIMPLYPEVIGSYYGIETDCDKYEILARIAAKRGCLVKGGNPDLERAARLFIDDFRSTKLGRLSLESPE
ncbi:MAG: ribosome biogenesis GTPase YlqF [Lachnospiraceae bacterium]|nr:ribosome biogenesis GTPase YlqF [Lachnospiraceae bacterium]